MLDGEIFVADAPPGRNDAAMDKTQLNPRFFKNLEPARWEEELCADLAPIMRLVLAEPGNAITSMGLENVKMPDLTILLRHPPSASVLAEVETLCAADPNLRAHPVRWFA